jgi:hypothetical protein
VYVYCSRVLFLYRGVVGVRLSRSGQRCKECEKRCPSDVVVLHVFGGRNDHALMPLVWVERTPWHSSNSLRGYDMLPARSSYLV